MRETCACPKTDVTRSRNFRRHNVSCLSLHFLTPWPPPTQMLSLSPMIPRPIVLRLRDRPCGVLDARPGLHAATMSLFQQRPASAARLPRPLKLTRPPPVPALLQKHHRPPPRAALRPTPTQRQPVQPPSPPPSPRRGKPHSRHQPAPTARQWTWRKTQRTRALCRPPSRNPL